MAGLNGGLRAKGVNQLTFALNRTIAMKLATFLLSLIALISLANAAAAQVNISFQNNTSEPAQLVWLNGNNQTVYATVQPGQTHRLQSFAGHQWKFAGQLSGTFATVSHEGQVVSLGAAQPAPIVPQYAPAYNGNQPSPIILQYAPRPQVQAPVGYLPVSQPQSTASVNDGVVNYARSMVGQKVGNGQCTELAIAALRSVNAEVKMDYTWGQEVRVDEVQPGDVMQLQSPSFEYSDGRKFWSDGPHTAVVVGVKGSEIEVLEQNVAGSPVQAGQYDARYLKAGTMKFYRPVKLGQANLAGGFQHNQAQPIGPQPRNFSNNGWQLVLPQIRQVGSGW